MTIAQPATRTVSMKAVRLHSSDSGAAGLVFEEAPRPIPSRDELLIRVVAAGVTPKEVEWTLWVDEKGSPRHFPILGHEFSGVVESAGEGTSRKLVGCEVYGFNAFGRDGALAEYTIARSDEVALKPKSIDHLEAAAVPMSGLTAWQALFDHGKLAAGETVLVQGAAGGVGSFAVQLAHWARARVIGTASKENLEFLRSIGADLAIDYETAGFEDALEKVDVVLNTAGKEVGEKSMKILRRGGTLVSITDKPSREKAKELGINSIYFIVRPSANQLAKIAELIDEKSITPIVQTSMPLSRARDAYELGLLGHNRGKIVLKIA